MDGGNVLQLFTVVLLVACSAFFSSSEACLFSLGPVRLQALLERGHPRARVLEALLAKPRRLLVTILIGNELVNIGTAVVTASFWGDVLGHEYGFWTVTIISTATALPLLLLFGEIIPKTMAVKNSEGVSLFVARPLSAFSRLITPVRWVLRRVADAIVRLFGSEPRAVERAPSEKDFRMLLDVGKLEGVIEEQEHRWIRNVFDFDERPVRRVMTPRSRMFSLPADLSADELLVRVREAGYSRIPVHEGSLDNVVGILYAKDLLPYVHGGGPKRGPKLRRLLRAPVYFPGRLSAADVFRELRARRTHCALIVDEYGGVLGIVTMEDLLEELFGEIADERDRDEEQEERRPSGSPRSRDPEGAR